MSFTVNCVRFSSFARPGTFSRSSTLQSPFQFSRRMSSDTSGTSHAGSSGMPTSSLNIGPWDVNNRIRVIGATLGLAGAVGMLFDTFYRRATKQELNQAMEKLDAKIDREMGKLDAKIDGLTNALLHTNQHVDAKIDKEMGKLDAKIDGLTNALLHTNQRDKISAEAENRELRREIERLKSKEAKT